MHFFGKQVNMLESKKKNGQIKFVKNSKNET